MCFILCYFQHNARFLLINNLYFSLSSHKIIACPQKSWKIWIWITSIMFHWCFVVHFWSLTGPGANSLLFYGNEQHEHFLKLLL